MVLVVWMLLHMLLAELGSVSAGADVQPTPTHNVFLLMVLNSVQHVLGAEVDGCLSFKPIPVRGLSEVGVEAAPHDVGTSIRKIVSHSVSDECSWDRQSCSLAAEECSACGQVSSMPAQQMDSDPFQTTFAECSSDPPGSRTGALSGSTNAEPANVASSFDNPGLDVGTQVVDALVADYPHRQHTNLVCVQIGAGSLEAPQASTVELGADSNHQHQVDGSIGIAASAEIGPAPRVDDSTPESIVRITRKYSLADAVDGLLFKAPSDLHDVSSCPLSGDPVMGPEDSGAEVVLPCILESGLVHALPLSLSKQELDNLMPMSQVEGPPEGDLAHATALFGTALDCNDELLCSFLLLVVHAEDRPS
ncbi:hypothetical protein Nepgr_017387 [Nepenthes gracilis]|uniref:Uncharacterized protein n=1 Tax=Nepenthes gracilis TaxID=150966 RepID=A0AAD3SSK0_NEPGR|nr:hypothetical protein Nepgr_017387 [Nepenthes gracilis]